MDGVIADFFAEPFKEAEKDELRCLYAMLVMPRGVCFFERSGSNIIASSTTATASNPAVSGLDRFVGGDMTAADSEVVDEESS